jgi:hypothetical protein
MSAPAQMITRDYLQRQGDDFLDDVACEIEENDFLSQTVSTIANSSKIDHALLSLPANNMFKLLNNLGD